MSYLYLIYDGTYTKIGFTNDTNKRLKQLQTGNPNRLNILYSLKTDLAEQIEYELLNKYSKYRLNGEWFKLENHIIGEIVIFLDSLKNNSNEQTNQKLEIFYDGMVFAQDMHQKMIYVNELEVEILKYTGLLDKRFNTFMTRKDTKEFIDILKISENLNDEEITYGRGKTKRIHHLLAFKFATWVSKEFEIKVYKFFLEQYPAIRELGGDKYNEFRDTFLPKVYDGDNSKWVIINMNMYINAILEKENGWNKQTKLEYKARDYIYSHIMLDIKRGLKPKNKQLVSNFINERIDYHFESLLMLEEIARI